MYNIEDLTDTIRLKLTHFTEIITIYEQPTEFVHWLWNGNKSKRNHTQGRLRFNGKMEYPHRVVMHLLTGFDLNNGSQLNHKRTCAYSLCCNPDCLYIGTVKENVADSIAAGTNYQLKKTNCSNCGGPYTVSPTTGHRYCQQCKNERRDKWRANKKEIRK